MLTPHHGRARAGNDDDDDEYRDRATVHPPKIMVNEWLKNKTILSVL
jgi:hypothetical protein